ncbi:DEAD/DEAH box helicase [Phycicoccus endophyticus]|uniref:DEAD/DEAH box helicase n=1 Tax=Phycicoccus endophyticus TaxID=1690220 RepID=A0A7G9R4K1_9MICO|nr:DEAD/DEAH box helicase [Phycicoccus endophyticus]NHI18417.1 DEAD/DEAH box helicase [Phycicoccus endophyticus]QNN50526.1 DEAD/DEAH box helicase [Phycicoccus endophyticus]GGL23979.1 helicase [Phycicoccus endophyticus]
MASPAERYAAAAARNRRSRAELGRFTASLDFPLDDFQLRACEAVEEGKGVLVAAPTGAGKTVVGEFAVHLGLATGRKTFYTTPIKALSNQKYHDLVRRHGAEHVGLLTGDSSVNGEAPVVVMTTEVLRNMMYAGSSTLSGLGFVVMDEVHYLADRFRGAVWEEVIIHLPESVQVVSLSATVSNAEEFGAWLAQVRGNHEVVVSEHRPVPLFQHMLVGTTMFDLFAGNRVNPDLLHAIRGAEQRGRYVEDARRLGGAGGRRGGRGRRDRTPPRGPGGGGGGRGFARGSRPGGGATRAEVVADLDREGLLPAITFIFSRAGCEAAVGQLLAAGIRLVPDREGDRIRRLVEQRVEPLAEEDLGVLGYWDFLEGLGRGFAAHHAGMLPLFREIVEELFTEGRIRAVFATETLALGINMPARTVVLEKLVKYNGEAHVDITPAEYTQLTGRAGRRGIDVEGHAVVQWTRGMDPMAVGGLASTRTYPLRSSFRPTYNMAVNLVAQVGREVAREVLETSFAQFQADRSVVGLSTQLRKNAEALEGYAEAMHCDLGDFREYARIRRELGDAEKDGRRARAASRRAEAAVSLERLRVGDVIRIPAGRRAGWAVVVQPARTAKGTPTGPGVVTEDHQFRRLTLVDVPEPVEAQAHVTVPRQFNPKSPKSRRDLATSLRIATPRGLEDAPSRRHRTDPTAGDTELVDHLRRQLRDHPCHECPKREDHARWAERWWRLRRETTGLQRRVEGRTNTVARTFDRICEALESLGYLAERGTVVTERGERLRRLYSERDLLAAECLRHEVWKRLDAPGLAAALSALVHEPRHEEADVSPRMPTEDVAEAVHATERLWSRIEDLETEHDLPSTSVPDGGMAWMVHRWASGGRLEDVLRGQDMAAGDFVRRCKQLVDLLDQVADAAGDAELRRTARRAVDAVMRGVVAADRLD